MNRYLVLYVIIVIHSYSNLQQDYHSSINCCILQQPCRCWPSWFNDGILWFSPLLCLLFNVFV